MGAAAYNRASNVIRQRIDLDAPKESKSLPGSVTHPAPEKHEPIVTVRRFEVGDKVYCNVRGLGGWPPDTVTAVKRGTSFKQDKIKVNGRGPWCPAYNFQYEFPTSRG